MRTPAERADLLAADPSPVPFSPLINSEIRDERDMNARVCASFLVDGEVEMARLHAERYALYQRSSSARIAYLARERAA